MDLGGEDATLVLLTDLHHHPSYDAAISAKCLCRADAAGSPQHGEGWGVIGPVTTIISLLGQSWMGRN